MNGGSMSANQPGVVNRNMIFVSHANPEDNLFARWLALRLAREGYPVWCDLTQLLGGEDFWRDIETAIRDRTAKFLFVLSKTSNVKAGPLMEVAVARKVGRKIQDFIVPLRIDDLRSDDINIELHRLNYVDFSKGWSGGYKVLLEKLEKDGLSRDPRFTPDAVTKWWRKNYPATEGVSAKLERCLSNWFEFSRMPGLLHIHSVRQSTKFEKLIKDVKLQFPIPAYPHAKYILTFGEAEEIAGALAEHDLDVANSMELKLEAFRHHGLEHPEIDRQTARNILMALFRDGFDRFALSRGLIPYELSGGAKYHWFKKDLIVDDKVFFLNAAGGKNWRQMVGFKSLSAKEGECRVRNWHFGIQARPHFWPFTGLAVRAHVAFTENGMLYDSKARQHAARRNQCKSWYNDDWLGRILAAMSFLAGEGKDELSIPLSAKEHLVVRRLPVMFESPVSFEVVEEQPAHEEEAHHDPESAEDEESAEEGGEE
jgi:hypothetical protein